MTLCILSGVRQSGAIWYYPNTCTEDSGDWLQQILFGLQSESIFEEICAKLNVEWPLTASELHVRDNLIFKHLKYILSDFIIFLIIDYNLTYNASLHNNNTLAHISA